LASACNDEFIKLDTASSGFSVTHDGKFRAVANSQFVTIYEGTAKKTELAIKYTPTCLAMAQNGETVVVGGQDSKIRIYHHDHSGLREAHVFTQMRNAVSSVAFSPDTTHLAASDSTGKIIVFDIRAQSVVTSRWVFHTARVDALTWDAAGEKCCSGGLDGNAYIWNRLAIGEKKAFKNAHKEGVTGVAYSNELNLLITSGRDGCVKVWE